MSLSFIKTWVFDLDNTLYPPEENIFSQIDEKMTSFIAENLKISHEEAFNEWIWSGSVDAFVSMCALRCKPDTQYETQVVANNIDEIMGRLFPVSWTALRMYEE